MYIDDSLQMRLSEIKCLKRHHPPPEQISVICANRPGYILGNDVSSSKATNIDPASVWDIQTSLTIKNITKGSRPRPPNGLLIPIYGTDNIIFK